MPIDQSNPINSSSKWFRILSPCVLAMGFCCVAMITSFLNIDKSGGWSFLGIIVFLPTLFLLWITDFITKAISKGTILYIWLVELLLVGIVTWYLLTPMFGYQ